ncbi:GNAT family N-acetyltransferase [Roseisalinus antarcticus]|uniref:N-acetyltransferase domain-containing protein n=1 Tax=Roseisalinus antarcticus TaxID=254357 RepID=A0A1Y5SC62_9RHOB|nr:GNAT family N-acetyltransferase [Roseisalinus antarcticus]SLN37052.1 hypothetical protein ROA7023_01370 [Roseisalinus antarcticus]
MLTLSIPDLETDRLVFRAPRAEDVGPFRAFLESERSRFLGGPMTGRAVSRAFGHCAGLWVLRGYSSFVGTLKESGRAIGLFGAWYPMDWPEPEFAWTLWDGADEGQGYVAEAMDRLIPWSWETLGLRSAISVIDDDNLRSARVAERLGAVRDPEAEGVANRPGSPFHEPESVPARIYRHSAPGSRGARA